MTTLGARFNADKIPLHLVMRLPHALSQFAMVLQHGVLEYGRDNYKKGLILEEMQDSLLRHVMALANGEALDSKTGLPHTAFIIANAMFLAELTATKAAVSYMGEEAVENLSFPESVTKALYNMMLENHANKPEKAVKAKRKTGR